MGPTGVGKNGARSRSRGVFVRRRKTDEFRIDMSEYMEEASVSRPDRPRLPGYVGYEEGGQLTEQVSPPPLLGYFGSDEIEKGASGCVQRYCCKFLKTDA